MTLLLNCLMERNQILKSKLALLTQSTFDFFVKYFDILFKLTLSFQSYCENDKSLILLRLNILFLFVVPDTLCVYLRS